MPVALTRSVWVRPERAETRFQHRELALGQAVGTGFLGVDVERQLQHPVHQVAGRVRQSALDLRLLA